MYTYIATQQNVTNWGVTFSFQNNPVQNIQYQIYYNSTRLATDEDIYTLELLAFMRGMDEAIYSVLNDPNTSVKGSIFNAQIKDWPLNPPSVLSDTIVLGLGPTFFFCSVMVIFINTLDSIVLEKELKLRHGMVLFLEL